MTAGFLAGAVAGYGVAVPVGTIAVLIVGLAARTSLRIGAAAALGVATADGLYAAVAVGGGAALAGVIAPVAEPLRLLSAGVLLVLATLTGIVAVRRYRRPDPVAREPAGLGTPLRAYAGLFALTLLNPATVIYFAALVLGGDGRSGGTGVLFVLGVLLASASWQLLLAGGGSLVGRVLVGPRGRLLTALVSSAVIVALAGWLLLPG